MKIYSKKQLNKFNSLCVERLLNNFKFKIKPLKLSSQLSVALGFNSHNHLIDSLPYKLPSNVSRLDEINNVLQSLLTDKFGFTQTLGNFITTCSMLYFRETTREFRLDPKLLETPENWNEQLSIGEINRIYADEEDVCLILTKQGSHFDDTLDDLRHHQQSSSTEQFHEFCDAYHAIMDSNPHNHYLKAHYIGYIAPEVYQDGWDSNVFTSSGGSIDSVKEHEEYAKENAKKLIRITKETIKFYEILIGNQDTKWANPKFSSFRVKMNSFFWPNLLFWGAKIAFNSGDEKLSKRWFNRYWRVTKRHSDSWGGRYYLAALSLLGHANKVTTYIKKDDYSMWGKVCLSLEAYKNDQYDLAIKYMREASIKSWAVLELFNIAVEERGEIKLHVNTNSPATIQELNYVLRKFWIDNPDCKIFFKSYFMKNKLNRLLIDYHLFMSNEYAGQLYKSHEERVQQSKTKKNFTDKLGIPNDDW